MSEAPLENLPYGMLAEFDHPDDCIAAIKKTRAAGYKDIDAYSPYAVGGIIDALGFKKSEIGPIMFIGGMVGAISGFCMQVWTQAIDYPLNIGGKPLISWPMFIPVTFEMMILTASLSGVFGLIALCGLPMFNHPLFNSERFGRASRDRFFLCIEASDAKYDTQATQAFLATLAPLSVEEVPQ